MKDVLEELCSFVYPPADPACWPYAVTSPLFLVLFSGGGGGWGGRYRQRLYSARIIPPAPKTPAAKHGARLNSQQMCLQPTTSQRAPSFPVPSPVTPCFLVILDRREFGNPRLARGEAVREGGGGRCSLSL